MLVELSAMEQRYQAVLAIVQDGWKVSEVAEHLEVSRQERPRLDWTSPGFVDGSGLALRLSG